MTLTDYARVLRRRWIGIVVLIVLGAVGGFVVAHATPAQYESTGGVLVSSSGAGATTQSGLTQGSTFIQTAMPSYVVLATSDTVLQPVIESLGLRTSPSALSSRITASTPLNTAVLRITAVGPTPDAARNLAEAVTRSVAVEVPQTSPSDTKGHKIVATTIIEHAVLPTVQSTPQTKLDVGVGAIIGLVLGLLYALLRRFVADTISDPADLAESSAAPVIGRIPGTAPESDFADIIRDQPLSAGAESMRSLAANLRFLGGNGGPRSVVISAPDHADSAMNVARALAVAVAQTGRRVLFVDGDLRSPSVPGAAGAESGTGLSEVLAGKVELRDAQREWGGVENLSIVTPGAPSPNPGQLLSSQAMRDVVAAGERDNDFVVIASAPVLTSTDPVWLAHASGGVLLVVRRRRTSRRRFTRTIEALNEAGAPVLGLILTRMPRSERPRTVSEAPPAVAAIDARD